MSKATMATNLLGRKVRFLIPATDDEARTGYECARQGVNIDERMKARINLRPMHGQPPVGKPWAYGRVGEIVAVWAETDGTPHVMIQCDGRLIDHYAEVYHFDVLEEGDGDDGE